MLGGSDGLGKERTEIP